MDVLTVLEQEAPAVPRARKERRRAQRDEMSGSLTVLWGTNSQEEKVSQASLVDVSARGAKFRVIERIAPGSWLMFNHHAVGICGRGTVRYCRMVKCSYLIGVEFSGGTGWHGAPDPFQESLRNLKAQIAAT